jgi:Undecaprenyl-phosphate galactose phosphotransferase WbaP
LISLVNRIQPLVKNLSVIPDLLGMPVSNIEVNTMFNQKVILLTMKNKSASFYNYLLKRFLDIFVGTFILIAAIPFMLLIMLIIKLDSSGSVFHIAKRLGKNGREFNCYKFRTMYLQCDTMLENYFVNHSEAREEWDEYAKLRDFDPRVTKMGKWLRKFSLDELPQILNVIIGNMSLVGPRPYLPREREKMGSFANIIFEAIPGITGLWQVSGRNEISFDDRLKLDAWYIRNWSPWLDLTMLFKTVGVVLQKKGAC